MYTALTILHLGVCFFLILVVLLQTGKGADLAGAFGMGGSQTAFGARGAATLLSRLTTISAIVFMVTSFTLALYANRQGGSVVSDEPGASAPAPPIPTEPLSPPPADANTGAPGPQAPPQGGSVPPAEGEQPASPAADPNQS